MLVATRNKKQAKVSSKTSNLIVLGYLSCKSASIRVKYQGYPVLSSLLGETYLLLPVPKCPKASEILNKKNFQEQ